MLDAPITISSRELLSVSPDVRRFIKDQVTTKRVGTSALIETMPDEDVRILLNNVASDKLIVAKDVEELRAIDVIIEGRRVEATIDDGSQILTVRQDLWEKFGVPLRSDKKLVMESANKSKENTMGLIQDLKINMGGLDFYVQV
ncbi:hypothetical protein BYT27DRAFT_7119985, partial [Phlegmacium glaucopus]